MIIYKVINRINGKCYIGQTIQILEERKNQHLHNYIKTYFHNALKKYGEDNFDWEIIEKCDSKNELDEMEFHYIKQYNSHIFEGGYNLTWGGEGITGYKHSDETKTKIGNKSKQTWNNRNNNNNNLEEYKTKISIANIKRYEDPKEREKLSMAQKKRYEDPKEREKTGTAIQKVWNNSNSGLNSIERNKKISESRLGKKNPMFGIKWTKEQKENMSKINKSRIPWNKNVKHSEETCIKMSESQNKRRNREKKNASTS